MTERPSSFIEDMTGGGNFEKFSPLFRDRKPFRGHDMKKMKDRKQVLHYILTTFILLSVVWGLKKEALAAFPYDMEQKQVIADAIVHGPVTVYEDSARKKEADSLDGNSLVIRGMRVKDGSIYGIYQAGEKVGRGWFDIAAFVLNPEYDHVYATVRARMTAYTSPSCKEKQGKMGKYTGVISVSRKGDARQVIYDCGDHYRIGWLKGESWANTLHYDGRPKKILADGNYSFRCGYGTESGTQGTEYHFRAAHLENDTYYLEDAENRVYLTVRPSSKGTVFEVSFASEPEEGSVFFLRRKNSAYTIQSSLSGSYLYENKKKQLLLTADRSQDILWRISAAAKVQDAGDPFVLTQYDPQWCYNSYGSEGCMGTAGCGILAPVNAVYALTGQYMDVMELADFAVDEGYRIEGSGTEEGIFKAAAQKFGEKYGFAWDGSAGKIKALKKKLLAGDVAVAHVPGHYVCISAYDKDKNKFLLLDSNCLPKREDSPYGDWISQTRLEEGYLAGYKYFFYKLADR